ncbi:MAG: GyrI-like domain-containing protein [Salinivirgaceae bacterium]
MKPRIEQLTEKKLVGMHLTMTNSNNRTVDLWRSFMPRRREIVNKLTTDLFSMQVYSSSFDFNHFDLVSEFEKWAAVEVSNFNNIPNEMNSFTLPGGLYAVFIHKGAASAGTKSFQYIFGTWLPSSEYILDQRPHFEILGEKYKNEDPSSEEEIWIPIKKKLESGN